MNALGALPEHERLPLVVVGRKTSYYQQVLEEIRVQKLEGSVLFLTGVEFNDLPAIYAQAQLFIYPSFFEGFGIPLIEAISCGVPVITSIGSCFHEAAGTGAVYVDPHDYAQMADAISSVLQSPERAKVLKEEGKKHILQFEPALIAENLNNIYRVLANEGSGIKRPQTV